MNLKNFLKYFIFFLLFISSIFSKPISDSTTDYLEILFLKIRNNDSFLKKKFYEAKAYKYKAQQTLDEYKPQLYFQSYYGYDSYSVSTRNKDINTTLKYYNFYLKQPVLHIDIINKWKSDNYAYKSQYYQYLNTYQNEKSKIVKLFINLILLKERIKLLKQQEKLYNQLLKSLKLLVDKNRISFITYLDYYKESKDNLQLLAQEISEFKSLKFSFKQLTGETPNLNFSFRYRIPTTNFLKKLNSLTFHNVWKNYEFLAQKMSVLSSKYDILYRKSKKFPSVDIMFSYTYTSSSSISIASRDKRAIIVLSFPIYSGGEYFDEIKEARNIYKSDLNTLYTIKDKLQSQFIEKKSLCEEMLPLLNKDLQLISQNRKILQNYIKELNKGSITYIEYIKREILNVNYKIQFINDLQNFLYAYLDLISLTSSLNKNYLSPLNQILIKKGEKFNKISLK